MNKDLVQNIKMVVGGLLRNIPQRSRDIITRRFGLKSGRKETLESIGKSYSITRERVRQIEEAALDQLRKQYQTNESQLKPYVDFVSIKMQTNGGFLGESYLFEQFCGNPEKSVQNAYLTLVLALSDKFSRFDETDQLCPFWYADKKKLDFVKATIISFINALNKTKEPIEEKSVPASIKPCLELSKVVGRNIFNQVGLITWSYIKPKGVKDKAFLVLKKESSPKHFRDITSLINNLNFSTKKANVQTVHNELIKDKRFVLVGRGTYGLSEWGYKSGTVKDILVDILGNSKKSLRKEELVAKVLSTRMFKENTIILNLHDSKTFAKNEDGTYTLRKS
jgi:hypothetical protein